MIKFYIMIIIIGILGSVAYGAKYYYDTTQKTISVLKKNNAKLEVANEENQATIKTMIEDTEKLNSLVNSLNNEMKIAESYREELISKLQKHDLTALSLKKPKMIEKRINDGTKELFDSFESISNRSTD